jgi:lipid II:glycine glycyltransferase (peptidoglycan interpeptide bridge formation enzyme)
LDINELKSIQKDLPDELKMKILLSVNKDKVGAGALCSAIGNTGVYFLGATNDVGMKDQGSYLIQRKIMEWLKSIGCDWYNLHGINPVTNPGTFKFKDGICGKNGKYVHFIGNFDTHMNLVSHLSVKYGEMLRKIYGFYK